MYWSVQVNEKIEDKAAWSYPNPTEPYSTIANFYAFYASKMEKCFVGDELARPQAGDFYGGGSHPTSSALSRAGRAADIGNIPTDAPRSDWDHAGPWPA